MSQPSHGRLALALPGAFVAMVLMFGGMAPCAAAEEPGVPRYRLGLELKANWRDSEQASFPNPFPFETIPGFDPPLPRAFLRTVDAGSHAEVSVVTLRFEAHWSELLAAKVKLDFIDRYDRNPTTSGDEFDIDEAWLRWGREIDGGGAPSDRRTVYAKLGKFGKFERQDDRHLESYGLMSTTFNRLEDVGLEVGIDFTRNLYAKVSYSQGNPLFFRDVNALAGDNGLDGTNFLAPGFDRDRAFEFNRGFPVFYDADVDFEDVDFENPELGLGVGWRWSSDRVVGDVMAWAYRRELAESVELDGTFYHGDLDLLLGPLNMFRLAVKDDDKAEVGANFWLYREGFSLFGQYVDQDLAGMSRAGFEVEAAWSFELPLWVAAGGRQLFPWIAPAVRYSDLDSDIIEADPRRLYPAPSVKWDWTKLDLGLRLGLWEDMDLTVEWANVEAETARGPRDFDEFLLTLRLGFERGWGE